MLQPNSLDQRIADAFNGNPKAIEVQQLLTEALEADRLAQEDGEPKPGMTLDEVAALPKYTKLGTQGRQYAIRDWARMNTSGGSDRVEASRDAMIDRQSNAWSGSRATDTPLNDQSAAYSQMAARLSDAWKNPGPSR